MKARRPRGDSVGPFEKALRERLVEGLMLQGRGSRAVCAAMREFLVAAQRGPDGKVVVPERVIRLHPISTARYIRDVRLRWERESAEERPTKLAARLARLHSLARKLEEKLAFAPLVAIERLITEVEGLRRIGVEFERREPVDLSKLSEKELAAMERLVAKAEGR